MYHIISKHNKPWLGPWAFPCGSYGSSLVFIGPDVYFTAVSCVWCFYGLAGDEGEVVCVSCSLESCKSADDKHWVTSKEGRHLYLTVIGLFTPPPPDKAPLSGSYWTSFNEEPVALSSNEIIKLTVRATSFHVSSLSWHVCFEKLEVTFELLCMCVWVCVCVWERDRSQCWRY